MRSSNQSNTAESWPGWPARSWYFDANEPGPLVDFAAENVAFYRQEAQRLLGLAASSPLEDAKRQFLGLAQQYETLAEHASRRSSRGL